jgi:hypothetical protein
LIKTGAVFGSVALSVLATVAEPLLVMEYEGGATDRWGGRCCCATSPSRRADPPLRLVFLREAERGGILSRDR